MKTTAHHKGGTDGKKKDAAGRASRWRHGQRGDKEAGREKKRAGANGRVCDDERARNRSALDTRHVESEAGSLPGGKQERGRTDAARKDRAREAIAD